MPSIQKKENNEHGEWKYSGFYNFDLERNVLSYSVIII